jgi:hypothetical protein
MTPARTQEGAPYGYASVIDDLDRCEIALQYLAEGQSDSLTVVLELLVERLQDAIGQTDAQLRQCTCAGSAHARETPGAAPRGVLTVLLGSRQTPLPAALGDAEDLDTEEDPCPDASLRRRRGQP